MNTSRINPFTLSKPRQLFMDRFIKQELTPKEELFCLANAYHHSTSLRMAAIHMDTEPLFRHQLPPMFNLRHDQLAKYASWAKGLQSRFTPVFENRLREFIYNQLEKADSFPITKLPIQNKAA